MYILVELRTQNTIVTIMNNKALCLIWGMTRKLVFIQKKQGIIGQRCQGRLTEGVDFNYIRGRIENKNIFASSDKIQHEVY